MVIFLVEIADNVVVHNCVFAWSIEPGLVLRVIRSVLQALQLVAKVEDVVGLLVAEGSVLILSQNFHLVLLLDIPDLILPRRVSECLCDWVVLDFLELDELTGDLFIRFGLALEGFLRLMVSGQVLFPGIIAI